MKKSSDKIPVYIYLVSVVFGICSGIKEMIRQNARTYLSRYRHNGVKFAVGANADDLCVFEGLNRIWHGSVLSNVRMGRHSYCGINCNIRNCDIGRFCSIGANVVIGLGRHPTDYASTYPGFYSKNDHSVNYFYDNKFEEHEPTIIGNDVWVGYNVTVSGGVKIGDGSIIGSCAVVTKDVPPYSIVGGVPARIIRYRYDMEVIEKMRRLKWWSWDEKYIKEMAVYFNDPSVLYQMHETVNGEKKV